jgi:hypothetical protein
VVAFHRIGVGYVADQRGFSRFSWFFIAMATSAPVALLYLIATPAVDARPKPPPSRRLQSNAPEVKPRD